MNDQVDRFGDLSPAGRAGGVAGWDGAERRQRDRRAGSANVASDRRDSDRRKRQSCHVCGHTFTPTPMQKRVCPSCRSKAMRMGANPGSWGAI
jgi:hypothetical protein